jgi:hypothetical protein
LRPSEGDRVRNAGGRGGRLRRRQGHEHERPDTAGPRRAEPARRLRIRIHAGLDLPSAHPRRADGRRRQLRTVVRFTPTEFFAGREQTGSLAVRATDPDTGAVKETVILVSGLARTDDSGGSSMRRMGKEMSTCQMCGGRICRGRGIVHGAWICANCTQYVSDESQPPRALLPENSPLVPPYAREDPPWTQRRACSPPRCAVRSCCSVDGRAYPTSSSFILLRYPTGERQSRLPSRARKRVRPRDVWQGVPRRAIRHPPVQCRFQRVNSLPSYVVPDGAGPTCRCLRWK